MITYAQNFEDVLLARLFREVKQGFYIDVGAWHPTLHSVTKHFYDLGWSGINIEPIQHQHRLFVDERPRDINLNVAVADTPGRLCFHECLELTSLSTANEAQAEKLRLDGYNIESYEVPIMTLTEVMAKYSNRPIDFLKVDVEGFVAWYDGLSRYYVRNEDVDLKGRLRLPPCVHDEFEFAELSELKHRYQDLISDRNNVVAASQRLDTELHAVESDRQAKSEVIDRLVIEVEELKRERDSLLKKVGQIGPDLERLAAIELIQRQKLAAKDQVIEALALRDLERKALLQGTADIAYQWRRRHVPPGYGEHIPPEFPANGLHVAIDTLEIVFGVSGGVETYMKMLASALIDSGRQVTLVCLPDQLNALRGQFNGRVGYFVVRKSKAVDLAIKLSNRLFGKSMRLSAATSMATFSRLGEDIGADILHSPVQIFSTLDFHVPSVLNLHDLQHLHFPENFTASDIAARNRLYGQSAALADAIVVSSEYVRNDLVSQMNVPAEKVFTVPVTWDPKVIDGLRKFSVQDAVARYQLPSAYAIYPAQFWPHKNHVRLVQALRIVRDKRPGNDLKLVFTGYRGHSGWPSHRLHRGGRGTRSGCYLPRSCSRRASCSPIYGVRVLCDAIDI